MQAWLLLLALVINACAFNIICYYSNESLYRTGRAEFIPEDIDPSLCKIIIFSFVKLDNLNIVAVDVLDEVMYSRLTALRKANKHLLFLLSVGGEGVPSKSFSRVAQNDETRKNFSMNVLNYLNFFPFDGIDINWMYPGMDGSGPEDKEKFTLLLQTLRETFNKQAMISNSAPILLSTVVAATKNVIDLAYELERIHQYVDYLILHTYDFHQNLENEAMFTANLYSDQKQSSGQKSSSVDWAVQYYLSHGVPETKIHISIVSFSRTFLLQDKSQNAPFSPAKDYGDPGEFTKHKGMLSYFEVCDLINAGGTVLKTDSQGNTYIVKDDLWIGYEEIHSVTTKACYVEEKGLGGAAFLYMDYDDFDGGSCGQQEFPLLNAVADAQALGTGCVFASASHSTTIYLDERLVLGLLLLIVIRARSI